MQYLGPQTVSSLSLRMAAVRVNKTTKILQPICRIITGCLKFAKGDRAVKSLPGRVGSEPYLSCNVPVYFAKISYRIFPKNWYNE